MSSRHSSASLAVVLILAQIAGGIPLSASAAYDPDLDRIRAEGRADGTPDGEREGRERGGADGVDSGKRKGYQQGYDQCLNQRKQQAYDQGYFEGQNRGEQEGSRDGQFRGYADGLQLGEADGRRDGDRRAEGQASRDAESPGRAKGRQEADATDSFQKGMAAGAIAGEQRARDTALKQDYPRGRSDHQALRFAEPIRSENSEDLARQPAPQGAPAGNRSAAPQQRFGLQMMMVDASASPDFRYARERRQYPDPAKAAAYSEGYRAGYIAGFKSAYSSEFSRSEQLALAQGREKGCQAANLVNVRWNYELGVRQGYELHYRRAFDYSYSLAYRMSYDQAFPRASADSYRQNYSGHYNRAFENFRADAYRTRVDELYRDGYAREESATFGRNYPAHAARENARGVADEVQEFIARPVRSVEFGTREEFADKVFEPGERVDFSFRLRNFSDQDLAGSDLRFEVEVSDASITPLRAKDSATQSIPARGAIRVQGILPVRFNEEGLGKTSTVTLRAYWRGQLVDSRTASFRIQNRAVLEFAEKPSLREGLETTLKVKVSNVSSAPISGPIAVELRADSTKVELLDTRAALATLEAGESRVVEFRVIGRTELDSENLPFAVQVTDGSRKRVVARDFTGAVPVINDYRVKVASVSGAFKEGVSRIQYVVRNASSRLLFSSLELHARMLDASGAVRSDVTWIGFNPQYLMPLERGEQARFVVPVFLKSAAQGGSIELEVRENGVPVVIHRTRL